MWEVIRRITLVGLLYMMGIIVIGGLFGLIWEIATFGFRVGQAIFHFLIPALN